MAEEPKPDVPEQPAGSSSADPAAAGPHERPLPPRAETSAEAEKQPKLEHPDGRIEHPWVSFETRDAWTKPVLCILLGVFAIAALEFFLVHTFFFSQRHAEDVAKKSPYPLAPKPSEQAPLEPRLEQIDRLKGVARENVFRIEASKERVLHRYGETPDKGFVHIPIEQAMEIVVPELKARTNPPSGQQRDYGLVDGGDSNSGRMLRKEPRW